MSRSLPSAPATKEGCELVTADGRAVPLVGAQLRVTAGGGIARAVLEQRFVNRDDETLHVTYRMPLPADGAVSAYSFTIGDRTIAGVVDKKAQARERFERAIASGHTAAILEQERADIFTQQIGNIPARETIVATIAVDLRLAWLPEGEWKLRFPTVIGPRYTSATADSAADVAATAIDTRVEGIAARLALEVAIADALADGRAPSSPTHAIVHASATVTLAHGAKLDRDLVIRWPVARAEVGLSVAAARRGDKLYGLVTIVPPARAAKAKPVARDLLILLDTSGSMGGAPLDKAKQVLPLLIETLGEGDRLQMIEFSDAPKHYKDGALAATPREKAEAIKWIRSREASGGTEMRAAVIEALSTLRLGAQRQVVVVTDGYVGGEQQILAALHAKLPASCRLHVLGVGAAVNRSLAAALARAGRGAEVLVGPDEDAERGAKRLLDRTRLPMLTNVTIAGKALVRHVPEHVPDVFEGAPLVAGIEMAPGGGELVVRGELADGPWEQRVTVRGDADGAPAIPALFAREHVADLESRAAMEPGQHDRAIEATGLAFQIATRFTSWVAVDESRVVTGPGRDESVPQELPYGTHAAAFGLRAASAGAPASPMKTMAFAIGDDVGEFEESSAGSFAPPPAQAAAPRSKTIALGKRAEAAAPASPTTGSYRVVDPNVVFAAPSTFPAKRRLRLWVVLALLAILGAMIALLWWLL